MNRGLRLKQDTDGNDGGGGWVLKKSNAFMLLSSQIKNFISVDLFSLFTNEYELSNRTYLNCLKLNKQYIHTSLQVAVSFVQNKTEEDVNVLTIVLYKAYNCYVFA